VDASNNPCIQSVFLESFPIYTAHFSQNGHEVILGSRHSAFFCYDMIAGKLINVPRITGDIALALLWLFLFTALIFFVFLFMVWCH